MQHTKARLPRILASLILTSIAILTVSSVVQAAPADNGSGEAMSARKAQIVQHWTRERRQTAVPRDLVIDPRGLGYLRRKDGSFQPYGHQIAAQAGQAPRAKPPSGGGGPTVFGDMDPTSSASIGASHTFSATVTDPDGLRSVTFVIGYPNGNTQSLAASQSGGTWSISISGFTDGPGWSWWIVAKDRARKGGNTSTSNPVNFSVDTGGGEPPPPPPPPTGDTVSNSQWLDGGDVQTAAGRIYFQMPDNSRRKRWSGYVCSGTVVGDGTSERSVIVTAAHCVYDDSNKAFARNVLFIPNQAGTSGSGTDTNCSNDPLGCWTPSFGVVDTDWTTRTFPNNIPWDYAYYVVSDNGAHSGNGGGANLALDTTADTLPISFDSPGLGVYTHALGYSYSEDPNFMYCAEDMGMEGADNWWLASCDLSGGSSGGPWVQPMDTDTGSGLLISVNSWGYTTSSGMAGPKLYGSSAECLFNAARDTSFNSVPAGDGNEGIDGC